MYDTDTCYYGNYTGVDVQTQTYLLFLSFVYVTRKETEDELLKTREELILSLEKEIANEKTFKKPAMQILEAEEIPDSEEKG